MTDIEFRRNVLQLARTAFFGNYRFGIEHGRNAYNECGYCGTSVFHNTSVNKITHDPSCSRLTAKQILEHLGEKAEFLDWPREVSPEPEEELEEN